MRTKTIILTLTAMLVAALANAGFAQGHKIGVFDPNEAIQKSVEGKKIIARLEERQRKGQSDLAKLDEEIRQLETRLNTQRLTLSQEAALQLDSDLSRKRQDRQRLAEDAGRDLQELQLRLFSRFESEVLPIIAQVCKEKGIDIVFDAAKQIAPYYNPALDITAEVIKRYDASKATTPAPTK